MSRAATTVAEALQPLQTIERLKHVTIELRAELDRTKLPFAEVARLAKGSIIRLPSSAGDTIALYIGDVLLGYGEVLVVDGVLTVRLSDLANPAHDDSTGAVRKDA